MSDDLIARLRKMAKCIYIAVEEPVAADIADGLTRAADALAEAQRELAEWRDGSRKAGELRKMLDALSQGDDETLSAIAEGRGK